MDVDLTQGRCAVVVLDVQRVFASPDGPFSNSVAGPMIDAINRLVAGAREHDVSVMHSRYVLRDDLRDAGLPRRDGRREPGLHVEVLSLVGHR